MATEDNPNPTNADTAATGGVVHAGSSDLSTYDPRKPIGTDLGTPTWADRFAAVAHGVEHGAAYLYHQVLAIEGDVTAWTASNPQLTPLIHTGVELAKDAIARTGFPVSLVSIVGQDIVAALRGMAALDNSVVGAQAPADPH